MLPDLRTDFSRDRSGGLVFPSLSEFSTVYCDPHKGLGIVNKAEIDVFLERSCFFDDPADVGNLTSGSSAFSKTSLTTWKFMVHILLKNAQLWNILASPFSANIHLSWPLSHFSSTFQWNFLLSPLEVMFWTFSWYC